MVSRLRLLILGLALAGEMTVAAPTLAAPDLPAPVSPAPVSPAPALPGSEAPNLPAAGTAARLTFLNAPLAGSPLKHTPKLGLSVNGGVPVRGVMDTGSTSVVIAARRIPNFQSLPVIRPGTLTYSSSGRVMKGVWVKVPVTVTGAEGKSITTRPMPVLAVTSIGCTPTARRCRPVAHPVHTAMIGIGFARGTGDGGDLGERNPFLNLEGMGSAEAPGPVRRGYLITRRTVEVGLSAASAQGMGYIKLDKAAQGPGWAPLPVCISVGGRKPPACGTALLDTGVTVMYLDVPSAQLDGQTTGTGLAPGKSVSLAFGSGVPSYSFAVGDTGDPIAPDRVILVHRKDHIFVNTSARLLNGFDYLYDADGGFVGFRPAPQQ